MRKMSIGLCLLALTVATGCGGSSPEGEKAAKPDEAERRVAKKPEEPEPRVANKPVAGESEHTFSLSVPFESVALAQGEQQSFRIGINRGENFREEVEIKLSGLPAGVTVETDDPVITPGSTGVTLTLQAASDAALGDFTFKVTGHTASSGEDFSKEIKITVAQK